MSVRRRIAAAAVAVVTVIAAAALVVTGRTAPTSMPAPIAHGLAGSPGMVALNLNVHGAVDRRGNGNGGRVPDVLRDVLAVVDQHQPDTIGMQEICRSQDRAIAAELAKRGYAGTMTKVQDVSGCGTDPVWGISLYARTPMLLDREYVRLPWGANPVGTAGREPRTLLCVTAPMRGDNLRLCTLHLAPSDPDRGIQEQKVADMVAAYKPGALVIVGDFNHRPLAFPPPWGIAGTGADWVVTTGTPTLTAAQPVPSSDHPAVIVTIT